MKHFCDDNCAGSRCPKCYLSRNWGQLSLRFPWLYANAKPFGAGCNVCKGRASFAKSRGDAWAHATVDQYNSLQPRRLDKHEQSKQLALGNHRPDLEQSAPDEHQMKVVLEHVQKHPIGVDGIKSVGGQKKVRKIVWCLAESHRQIKRCLWRAGLGADQQPVVQSTTLFQDTRKGRLSLRFTMGSSNIERGAGHFATVDIAENLDAMGIMQGTMKALTQFCTPFESPPHYERPHTPQVDSNLLDRVVSSVETYVSDSAGDEIRAGFMLAGQSTSTLLLPKFPGLKIVLQDKPHATRRNLSRGFKPDPMLDEVLDRFVFGHNSPTRLIQNSMTFKAWFAQHVRQQDPDMSAVKAQEYVKDLGFAPHRFESVAKPLGRIALFFPAFLRTILQIAQARAGKEEGEAARAFLEWISEKSMIAVGMLADASTENLQLTRLVDYQGFPVESLPAMVGAFRDRIRALFSGGGQPACFTCGFTGHMMAKVLRRQLLITLPARGARPAMVRELWGVQLAPATGIKRIA